MKDKVVLITGSSSGIGKETALRLSALGAKLVVTGPNEAKVTQVVQLCLEASPEGYEPVGVVADLTKGVDIERLLSVTIAEFKKLDALIHCAALAERASLDDPYLIPSFTAMMDVNVKSVLRLTQLATPYLEASKGCIVVDSSVAGIKPYEKWSAYCITKAALNMLSQCLALELNSKGIRVTSMKTDFFETTLKVFEDTSGQVNTESDESFIEPLRISGDGEDLIEVVQKRDHHGNLLQQLDDQLLNGIHDSQRSA